VSWNPPSPDTVTFSPERGALAVLAAAVAVAKTTLLAAHPELPIEEADMLGPPSYVETIAVVLLGQLDAIASTLHRYEHADDLAMRGPISAA